MKRILPTGAVMTCLLLMNSASAQLSQLGGGGGTTAGRTTGGTTGSATAGGGGGAASAIGAGAAGAGGGGQAGSTTEGIGGVTSQGIGAGGQVGGGVAGANAATSFIGGGNNQGFVGGNMQTQQNSNRQFRATTNTDVPQGGGQQQGGGTPRRIPTSLRIGFEFPQPSEGIRLMEVGAPPIHRIAISRPEFQGVNVQLSNNGVAVLSGEAPDAATRRLAGILVRQQSGVRQVENRILISAQ